MTTLTIAAGADTYTWMDAWASLPTPAKGADNKRTHGIACLPSTREVVVFHQADPGVLVYSPAGTLVRAWGEFLGAHGLTLVVEGGKEYLWLTDQHSAAVVKADSTGKVVQRIERPTHPDYAPGKPYVPTWVAVHAGSGDIWVADGYGQSNVHRYDKGGAWKAMIDGTEPGALGRFKCPHGIGINPKGELVIADRGNQRLQIYDADGRFLRGVEGVYHSPCSFDFLGDLMLVPELGSGVKLVRGDREVIADLGDNPGIRNVQGWPNLAGTDHVRPGRFNSPHGACFTPDGDILVAEWILGGRVTRLARSRAASASRR